MDKILTCMPTALLSIPSKGARRENCARCGTEVWVSPQGLIQAGVDAVIECAPCALPKLNEGSIMPPSDAVIEAATRRSGLTREEAIKMVEEKFGVKIGDKKQPDES